MTGNPVEQTGAAGRSSTGAKRAEWWADLTRLDPVLSPSLVAAILAAGDGPPLPPTPQPNPQIPVAATRQIQYWFTDLYGNLSAILPLTGVTWSNVLNGAGQFSGTLSVEDPAVKNLNWIEATAPNKTCVWVGIDGPTFVWGGLVQQRTYDEVSQTVQIQASEFWQYLNQRLQAKDYGATWATGSGAAGMTMAETIISDALNAANSVPISVATEGTVPSQYDFVASFPLSQQQAIGSLVQQLQTMGYLVGFDYATDVEQVGGTLTATITLSYPRRGRVAGTTGLTLSPPFTALTYAEDGTNQANQIEEMAASGGGVGSTVTWVPSMATDGYPLLEAVESHMVFSPLTYYTGSEVTASQPVLDAWGADDLALYAYPKTQLTVTVPLFGKALAIGDFIVGDDIRVIIPKQAGDLPPTCPRFPTGMDMYWRITQADVTVADEGLSTMQLTMQLPPSSTPQRPPQ